MSKSRSSLIASGIRSIKTDATIKYNMVKNFNLFFDVPDNVMDLAQEIVVKQRELHSLLKKVYEDSRKRG